MNPLRKGEFQIQPFCFNLEARNKERSENTCKDKLKLKIIIGQGEAGIPSLFYPKPFVDYKEEYTELNAGIFY